MPAMLYVVYFPRYELSLQYILTQHVKMRYINGNMYTVIQM